MGEYLKTDFDGNLKRVLATFAEEAIAFFCPEAHALIDFSKGMESLDTELFPFKQNEESPKKDKRIMDKLFKFQLKTGISAIILFHFEVEKRGKITFPKRMFTYRYRTYDKYPDIPFIGIAIYIDDVPDNCDIFVDKFLKCKTTYEFYIYKLSEQKEKDLIANPNIFAFVMLATLYAKETMTNGKKRFDLKHKLFELAVQRNYTKEKIVSLLGFVFFLLTLPNELKKPFLETYKNKKTMIPGYDLSYFNAICVASFGVTIPDLKKEFADYRVEISKKIEVIQEEAEKSKAEAIKKEQEKAAKLKAEAIKKEREKKAEAIKKEREKKAEAIKIEQEKKAEAIKIEQKKKAEAIKIEREKATKKMVKMLLEYSDKSIEEISVITNVSIENIKVFQKEMTQQTKNPTKKDTDNNQNKA